MEPWLLAFVTIFGSVITSSGLWAFLQRRDTRKSATEQLLLGLAHDRIIFLGMKYLSQGWITKDEYEDFIKYLWNPYSSFGGNGLAEKIMKDVEQLPIKSGTSYPYSPAQVIKLSEEHNVNGIPRPHSSAN